MGFLVKDIMLVCQAEVAWCVESYASNISYKLDFYLLVCTSLIVYGGGCGKLQRGFIFI